MWLVLNRGVANLFTYKVLFIRTFTKSVYIYIYIYYILIAFLSCNIFIALQAFMTTDHAIKPRARRYKISHIITVEKIYIYIYIVLHMAVM